MTNPVPNIVNTRATGGASTDIFITELQPRDPTSSDTKFPVQKRWLNTVTIQEFILVGYTASNGALSADWQLLSAATGTVLFLAGNSGGDVPPDVNGVVNVVGDGTTINIVGVPASSTLTASIVGGSVIDSINVDANTAPGTDPVLPTAAGLITITGAQVATGTVGANVIRTDSLAANSLTIEIQRTTAVAATDSTKNGVAHFDSAEFAVDSSGFVTLKGGGQAVDSFQPDTGTNPVVPDAAGLVKVLGQSVPNVSGIQVTGGTNELDIAMFSPFAGSFAFSKSDSGNTILVEVVNGSNTASSDAGVSIYPGGTSSGDPYVRWLIPATRFYALGIDNSDSDIWKLNTDVSPVTPSSGTTLLQSTTSGVFSLPQTTSALYIGTSSPTNVVDLNVEKSDSGSTTEIEVRNTSNTASSDAVLGLVSGGGSGGDPFVTYNIATIQSWSNGIDNSDSDSFKISASATLGTSDKFRIATTGSITFGDITSPGNFYTFPLADGTAGQSLVTNGAGTLSFQNVGSTGWTVIGASQTLAVNEAYFCTSGGALSLALPAVSAVGDTIEVVLDGSTSWTITQPNAGTQIRLGNQETTLGVGGTLASTAAGDWIELVCQTANARWVCNAKSGNISVV